MKAWSVSSNGAVPRRKDDASPCTGDRREQRCKHGRARTGQPGPGRGYHTKKNRKDDASPSTRARITIEPLTRNKVREVTEG